MKSNHRLNAWLAIVSLLIGTASATIAQRRQPEVEMEIDGDPVYRLGPPGMIPAIDDPEFLTGGEAASQMSPHEPVLGIVIGSEARAYSLWHLDSHEIVNDVLAGTPIAATW